MEAGKLNSMIQTNGLGFNLKMFEKHEPKAWGVLRYCHHDASQPAPGHGAQLVRQTIKAGLAQGLPVAQPLKGWRCGKG